MDSLSLGALVALLALVVLWQWKLQLSLSEIEAETNELLFEINFVIMQTRIVWMVAKCFFNIFHILYLSREMSGKGNDKKKKDEKLMKVKEEPKTKKKDQGAQAQSEKGGKI